MKNHFKVFGLFDGAHSATVTIDRDTLLFSIRAARRRKVWGPLHLSDVAMFVHHKLSRLEARERQARKRTRRGRRG